MTSNAARALGPVALGPPACQERLTMSTIAKWLGKHPSLDGWIATAACRAIERMLRNDMRRAK